MAEVLYRCPRTGRYAQGWLAEDASVDADQHTYISVACPACAQLHMVSPATHKVLGRERHREGFGPTRPPLS